MAHSVVTIELDNEEFSRAFLQPPHITVRDRRAGLFPFASLKYANDLEPTTISKFFVSAVGGHHLITGSTLVRQYSDPPSLDESHRRPDAAIFRSLSVPRRGRAHWADQRVPVVFFSHVPGADPFSSADSVQLFSKTGRERKKRLEQLSATAELLFAAQHRVFLFMLVVFGRNFRLVRWDRSGVVATPLTDYYKRPTMLCDCLRRLSLLDDSSLGFDTTATRLPSRDPDYLRMDIAAAHHGTDIDHSERHVEEGELEEVPMFRYVRSLFRDSLSGDWPRYRLQVQDGDSLRSYLVGKPIFRGSGTTGRGTRGYVAFDSETGCFVWLKDTWRASAMATEREGDVLRQLNDAGIENVPTLECHGDVHDQATVTDIWWERKHAPSSTSPHSPSSSPSTSSTRAADSTTGRKRKRGHEFSGEDGAPRSMSREGTLATADPLQHYIHYRVVVKEIAMPLKKFKSGKQLVSIVLDCLHAHRHASTNPAILRLHRDVSGDNILIYPRIRPDKDGKGASIVWSGLLIDWELSLPRDSEEVPQLVKGVRLGTRQFMSVSLLDNPLQPVRVSDELESFLHVLVYYSVAYVRSNCTSPNSWINNYFFYCGMPNAYTGGLKSIAVEHDGYLSTLVPEGPLLFRSPMDGLLGTLLWSFKAHYDVMEFEAQKARSPSPPSPSSSRSKESPVDARAALAARNFLPVTSLEDNPELTEYMAKFKARVPLDNTPTDEDRQCASLVADHSFVIDFIDKLLRYNDWPDDDRLPQPPAPPSPSSEQDVEQESEESAPSPKRRRKVAPTRETIRAAPSRSQSSMRLTRSRTRAAALQGSRLKRRRA
ncbi:hypothetical protein DICSQDRAFT_183831 [Dichomitus squalens LYAD-421 SS1]|uniref:Fungal-type protein kinase domain-containing protein n=1 Tax=Dichomitus squalens (strain LYAD-421) TaxID=732165 RepID=R7SJT7_DICSQ|nr:uncharacterized protein DICSQDRAFT_183831 [Dichomitus squalens LYAD-421 SS1]EJF56409.1 hypothetical protein DICSQDRAFT_183831 [Dichomitus squalens LYAD-421 SS1]